MYGTGLVDGRGFPYFWTGGAKIRIYSRALMVYLRAANCLYKYKIRRNRSKKVADIYRHGQIENVGRAPNTEVEEQYR
jgi:hypothetical protein